MMFSVAIGTEGVQDMGIVLWPDEDLLVVSGGSPLSLIDAYCVSILEGDEVHTLQLTSPVRGLLNICVYIIYKSEVCYISVYIYK